MRSALKQKLHSLLARFGLHLERWPRRLLDTPDCRLHVGLDHVLAHHLLSKGDPADVFFVQIGAFDGVSGDPLHEYVKRFGWQGILVEPQRRYFAALERTYAGCKGLHLLQAAVAEVAGTAELYTLAEPDAPDLPAWAPQIASFDLQAILRHRRAIPDLEQRLRREIVRTVTMEDVLAMAESRGRSIDLIQIDVEGHDEQLVRQIDLERFSPAIVRWEHKHLSRTDRNAAIRRLADHGYRILQEATDTLAYRPVSTGFAATDESAAAGSRET